MENLMDNIYRIYQINRHVMICFLLIIFFLITSSCKNESQSFENAKAITYADTESPNSLMPCQRDRLNAPGSYLSELVFDGLVNKVGIKPNGQQRFKWALADTWQEKGFSAEERRIVEVVLFPGVHWHDGRKFTADDVIFSWKALKESNAQMKGWLISFIKSINKIDNRTISIQLHIERSEEVVKELLSSFKILPRFIMHNNSEKELPTDLNSEGFAQDYAWKPIGTGPYKVEDFKITSATFKANEDYFLGAPKIKQFFFRRIEDYHIMVKSMLDKSVHVAMNIHPESSDRLLNSNFRQRKIYPYSFYAIAYNLNRYPFKSIKYRRLINQATNKIDLAKEMFHVKDVTAFINASVFPHNYQYVQDCEDNSFDSAISFNPKKAGKKLKRLRQKKAYTLLVSSELDGARVQNMANSYKQMMKNLDIQVSISDQSSSQYFAMIKQKNYDAVFVHFKGFDHFYDIRSLFSKKGKMNLFYCNNKKLKKCLKEFGKTISYEKLTHITKDIHKIVESYVPACFLFTLPEYTYHDNRIGSVIIHPEIGFAKANHWFIK